MQAAMRVNKEPSIPDPERLREEHRVLIARIASGRDRQAFESLFLFFAPRVKAMMMRSGANSAQAEDVVQDVMMTVWRKAAQYRPRRGVVASWVFTIARNARIDRLRRNSARPYEDVEALELASEESDAVEDVIASQEAERIAQALERLPYEQKLIIELAYMSDMAQSEISTKLDLPLGTVKSRMRLAYARLKADLEDLQ